MDVDMTLKYEIIHNMYLKLKDQLNLNVYKKNMRAVVFYQHRGFKIVNQKIDENTSEEESTMEWHRQAGGKNEDSNCLCVCTSWKHKETGGENCREM